MNRGSYYGTEVDGRWWRRYRAPGFFARGNGEWWVDESALHFRKLLSKQPLSIGWHEVSSIELGKWHAGRWTYGRPVMKVNFERDGLALSAGFFLSGDWNEMEHVVADLEGRLPPS